jgi:hypothetical protein
MLTSLSLQQVLLYALGDLSHALFGHGLAVVDAARREKRRTSDTA